MTAGMTAGMTQGSLGIAQPVASYGAMFSAAPGAHAAAWR